MKQQMAIEIGMGTDLRGADSTKAAVRAVGDALHRNALTVAGALGFPKDRMLVDIRVGAPDPASVRIAEVAAAAPYGVVTVEAVEGGLRVEKDSGATIIANAIVSVSFDMEPAV
ncbi:MAG: Lin0512 family protein [Pseudomonadota bacterium]